MRSRYLAAKLAFLVLALFTVSYQCAAQCLIEQCHEFGSEVPPCHPHNPTKGKAPGDVCKASLLLAAEVRIQSSDHRELSAGMPLSVIVPEFGAENALVENSEAGGAPEKAFAAAITLTTPLRI